VTVLMQQPDGGAARAAPELTIVVPTLNESNNVPQLVERLRQTLADVEWEVIFVDDDSPDGTAEVAKRVGATDARVRCIRRIGRRGLAGACLEGMLASQARFVAIIDADLQHDETRLPDMLKILRRGDSDLVVGTRYAAGGSVETLSSRRLQVSKLATRTAHLALGVELSDPMSGFFMMRRDLFERLAPQLSTQGFKLLLDIVVTAGKSLHIAEVPYEFRQRHYGASKLDARVGLEFLGLVLSKATNGLVSLRFIFFCLVGAIGIAVHFAALVVGTQALALRFAWAQTLATAVAIASNFMLNNVLTYRDQRLVGVEFFTGMIRFYIVSLVGAISNIGVGNWLFSHEQTWWVAGLAGAIITVVWNYVISSSFVWPARKEL
jgi:dolichol-phosphate mannosyltransferase